MKDIDPPVIFLYLFNIFIDLFSHCVEKITYQDICSYCTVRKTELSLYEIDLLLQMNTWAKQEINALTEK
jgi:hypothetical protein